MKFFFFLIRSFEVGRPILDLGHIFGSQPRLNYMEERCICTLLTCPTSWTHSFISIRTHFFKIPKYDKDQHHGPHNYWILDFSLGDSHCWKSLFPPFLSLSLIIPLSLPFYQFIHIISLFIIFATDTENSVV